MPTASETNGQSRYWLIICPEPRVRRGIWRTWYREKYLAIGWPPAGHCEEVDEPGWSYEGVTKDSGWAYKQRCLHAMKIGDKVIPFLLKSRIGPVATIRALHVRDDEWNPSVPAGVYRNRAENDPHLSTVPELGRRIEVQWDTEGMPPEGKAARVAGRGVLSRSTIRPIREQEFTALVTVLGDRRTWVDLDDHRGIGSR